MNKHELKKRWLSNNGKQTNAEVLKCLERGIPLFNVKSLEKYCGRWDLRGAKLSTLEKEKKIKAGDYGTILKYGSLKLKNVAINSIDFSYADISYSYWRRVTIENCLFEETEAKEIRIVASNFDNCVFRKTNLFCSYLNQNIGDDSGSFINIEFIESNLSKCRFYFPIINNCSFIDCNLIETDFDGSRFSNCKFKGELDSLWFRGYSTKARTSIAGLFNRINPRKFKNLMYNVDFSEATKIIGVSFSDGIDLSQCYFPKDENYLFIENLQETFTQVKKVVNDEWYGEDKRKALAIIDKVYLTPNKKDQLNDLIDKFILTDEGKDVDFGDKFFYLIKNVIILMSTKASN
jgi:uncharacterized protein YjbI with pentapeptide repeats